MNRTCIGVIAILVVVLMFITVPLPVHAQGGAPDLQITGITRCRVWQGYIPMKPRVSWAIRDIWRLTFSVRNTSPVTARPAAPDTAIRVTRRLLSGTAIQRVSATPPTSWGQTYGVNATWTYASIGGGHTLTFSDLFMTPANTNWWAWMEFRVATADGETNTANNVQRASWDRNSPLGWCPGYRPRAYGRVFKDVNRNGRQDRGEPGVSGVIVEVWQGSRRVGRTTSGWDGSWSISVSRPGTYSVVAIVPARVRTALGGGVSWTTPSHYFGVPLTGGSTGPYRFGLAAMPPPPPAEKPIEPRPEASIGWGTAVTRPVVVGQDPDRRGADVFVTIRVRPATYTWYEFNPARGRWEKKQATVTDYVDLNSIRLTATLTNQSRHWIRSELAARYPGARVRQPFWDLRAVPTYRIVRNQVLADGTHEVVIAVTRIPFEDPGMYDVRFAARTTGTSWPGSRVSAPNYLVKPAATSTGAQDVRAVTPLKVWLLDTTLTY